MKFKIDENLPVELAADLREFGFDAGTVGDEGLAGAPDPTVVDAAFRADRILLTLDKGIANLQRYPKQCMLVWFCSGRVIFVGASRIRFR